MKKKLFVLLTIMMCISLITGCGKKKKVTTDNTNIEKVEKEKISVQVKDNQIYINNKLVDLYKEYDGVYVRNYRTWDILEQKNAAIRNKYEPYNITTSTPFLYMIRECGGIATNAFVDGRNKVYGKNNFVNSNIGIETYVVELGNMINNKDLENVVNHSDLYMKGISESIQNYYN